MDELVTPFGFFGEEDADTGAADNAQHQVEGGKGFGFSDVGSVQSPSC